jgi:hypothetical protein
VVDLSADPQQADWKRRVVGIAAVHEPPQAISVPAGMWEMRDLLVITPKALQFAVF